LLNFDRTAIQLLSGYFSARYD
jgi:hypothetical protein